MSQFLAIVRWELRYYFRRISTWIYFGIFAAIAFLMMLASGGAFTEVNVVLGGGGKVLANSPFALAVLLPTLGLFGVSMIAAVAGNAIYRDYDSRMDPLFYTTPVSKGAFLGGRFVATLIVNTVILLGVAVGAFLATKTPWVKPDKIAPFDLLAYVQPYLILMLPNLLFVAAIFFALPALTRQMLPNYVGGVLLLVGYLLSGQYLQDIDNKRLAALTDPFGLRAFAIVSEYWSIAEKNVRHITFSGDLVANRAIWIAVGIGIFAIAFAKFRFAHAASEPKAKRGVDLPALEPVLAPLRTVELPATMRHFDWRARLTQYWSLTVRSFWRIVRNRYFFVIVGAGVLYLVLAAQQVGKLYGTTTWPVTYQMEEILNGSFGLFMLVIIAFYAGELVWAERDVKIHQITDATPTTSVATYLAKLTALSSVVTLLLVVIMITGILAQAAKGYYHFEVSLYVQALLGLRLVDLLLFVVLATTIHVVVNHKYLGHLLVVLAFVGIGSLGRFGLEHNLYQYASDGGTEYSDMNRWGHFVRPFMFWKLYWAAFAVLLAVLTNLLWVRGEETHARWRTHLARRRFGRGARAATALASLSFIGLGGFIFYNTNVENEFTTRKDVRLMRAELERRYKRFEGVPQPRITAVQVQVDLFPKAQGMHVRGQYVLRNKTSVAIDTVHLRMPREMQVQSLSFDPPARVVLADSVHEYFMHRLENALLPGDSILLRFELSRRPHGFKNSTGNTDLVANGTFVENNGFMPGIGYSAGAELTDDDDRRKVGLRPKPRMRPPTDPAARANNYISHDADWLDYDAIVSTTPDQIAITSGYLQREWTENGRRYFHYKMDAPILNLWAFQSARYAVKKDAWQAPDGRTIDIAVYYHPAHTYNVDRMIHAVKQSLTYYTAQFGPYQHRQVRIVEFPRYAQFAQSLPNTIPYSESIGFIARVSKPDDIDYPFYVTAHEVAHQWWAHQVIGADAQGSTMLSETLAQYSAMMVMEKEYGAANMRRFLSFELNRYLLDRSVELKREMPVARNENQGYIHYNKGSLVTYALRDYIGEARMNGAIRGFLNATKFKGPPYPTSLELVDSLRAATPDSLRYLIADLFETITLYELKTDSAVVTDAPADSGAGKYRVDLYITAKKLRADTLGKETEIPFRDWIDIGVYALPPRGQKSPTRDGVPIYLEKHQIHEGPQRVRVLVKERPRRAGIDPVNKLIDRLASDNTIGVQDRSKPPAPTRPRRGATKR